MKVLDSLGKINPEHRIRLTLGNFDGVHIGHQSVLQSIKKKCLASEKLVLITFEPHPQFILNQKDSFYLLTSRDAKHRLLESMGVDYLIEIPFTRDFSTQDPNTFLEKYLFVHPGIVGVYLGHDFSFGANKRGEFELVLSYIKEKKLAVELEQLPAYSQQHQNISSTLIRQKIIEGQIEKANEFLSRPYQLSGLVIKGNGRGKKIGYPTANIELDPKMLIPQKGVYITQTITAGLRFKSVTNIGHNPTFNLKNKVAVETHLLDFQDEIYGELIEVHFYKKLRSEVKFDTINDLVEQIHQDCQQAKVFNFSP